MSSFRSNLAWPTKSNKGQAVPGLRRIADSQTYSELFEASQVIWDHKPDSYERLVLVSGYLLRLSELKLWYGWNPDKKDFKIKTEVNRVSHEDWS